jgi:hypothetical protein
MSVAGTDTSAGSLAVAVKAISIRFGCPTGRSAMRRPVGGLHDLAERGAAVAQEQFGDRGVLGSARRISGRADRLGRAGLPPERVAAIRAPIGVLRCGKAPWEVAVSVIAEIMQAKAEAEP